MRNRLSRFVAFFNGGRAVLGIIAIICLALSPIAPSAIAVMLNIVGVFALLTVFSNTLMWLVENDHTQQKTIRHLTQLVDNLDRQRSSETKRADRLRKEATDLRSQIEILQQQYKTADVPSVHRHRPNFLIIGAQKAGTTWLHRMLISHPEVFIPELKELHFFQQEFTERQFEDNYLIHFVNAGKAKAIGEASTNYFWVYDPTSDWSTKSNTILSPRVFEEYLGSDTKFIVILRNPVARAISAFFHYYKRGQTTKDSRILELPKHFGIVDIGFYYRHLMRWFEIFPRDQFLILNFEQDIIEYPLETVRRVYGFLGINENFVPEDLQQAYNVGTKREISDKGTISAAGENSPTVYPEDLEKLSQIYNDDMSRTLELLGWDSNLWAKD